MNKTDLSLLERFRCRGDANAFAEIAVRYQDFVYGTCLRILGNAADSQDVSQECFLRLLRKADTVQTSLGGWLHRCATDLSIDELRGRAARKNREEVSVQMNGQSNHESDSAAPSWQELGPHLDRALDELPDDLREVVVEHFLRRRAQAEIAKDLGVSKMTVSRRLQDGIEQLRQNLKRAGVVASAAVLAALMTENASAAAAPAALAASLSKLTILAATESSTAAGAAAASVAGIGSLVKVLVAALAVAVVGAGVYKLATNRKPAPADVGAGRVFERPSRSPLPAPAREPQLAQTTVDQPPAMEPPAVPPAPVADGKADAAAADPPVAKHLQGKDAELACMNRLRDIGAACYQFAKAAGPTAMSAPSPMPHTLQQVVDAGLLPKDPDPVSCPMTGVRYEAVPDIAALDEQTRGKLGMQDVVIAWDAKPHERGRCVLFFDTHVQIMPEEAFAEKLLQQTPDDIVCRIRLNAIARACLRYAQQSEGKLLPPSVQALVEAGMLSKDPNALVCPVTGEPYETIGGFADRPVKAPDDPRAEIALVWDAKPHRSVRFVIMPLNQRERTMAEAQFRATLARSLQLLDAEPKGIADAADANAADIYRWAFAMMPKDKKIDEVITADFGTRSAEEMTKALEACQPALKLLAQAAAIERCDWGIDLETAGPGADVSHLGGGRPLARAACFRARCEWAAGRRPNAVEDLRNTLIMVRRVADDKNIVLISMLVQVAVEQMTINVCAEHLTDACAGKRS